MAEAKTGKTSSDTEATPASGAPVSDDRVDLFVPRGQANDEPNLLISINGVNYLLPKGKTSRVKRCVAEEYQRSERARERFEEKKSAMIAD